MKKILVFAVFFVSLMLPAPAIETPRTPIAFIYLNGSNTNTETSEADFVKGINKVHPYIKSSLESSDFVKDKLLNKGTLVIKEKPETFFWGYKSSEDLNTMDASLNWTAVFSPKLAQTVRSFISHCMHDAIWVQKSYNMQRVIEDLHEVVLKAASNNEKVILSGYSAGSFITYEYLIHKMPAMDLNNIWVNTDNVKVKPTCLDAVLSSGMAVYSANGEFIKNPDKTQVKNLFKNLNKYTETYCTPEDTVLGVINYASPLALFYSDMANKSIEINNYNAYLFSYLQRKNVFFLTVNYAEDPMGFPVADNLKYSDLKNSSELSLSDEGQGFFYSTSKVKSPATFIGAHLSYWRYPKKFAKMITDGYVEGYSYFYGL